jgi:hypothetical protein
MKPHGRIRTNLIEFAGIPGAGKTTLCPAILAELRMVGAALSHDEAVKACLRKRDRGGIPGRLVQALPEAFWMPLLGVESSWSELHKFSINHCGLIRLIFEMLEKSVTNPEWRECILYVFYLLGTEHELFNRWLPLEPVVVEEGFIQGILSAVGYLPIPDNKQIPGNAIGRYLECSPLPESVIWVDTPPHVSLERLLARPELPLVLKPGDSSAKLQRLEYLQACLQEAAEKLITFGVNVWRVESDGIPPAELAENWMNRGLNVTPHLLP